VRTKYPPRKGGKNIAENANSREREKMSRLNMLLINAICESLNFGEVILHFIELNASLNRDEIVYKPEAFARELEKIFGDSSSMILETIVRKLYASLGMKIREGKKLSFRECIMEAAKNIID